MKPPDKKGKKKGPDISPDSTRLHVSVAQWVAFAFEKAFQLSIICTFSQDSYQAIIPRFY